MRGSFPRTHAALGQVLRGLSGSPVHGGMNRDATAPAFWVNRMPLRGLASLQVRWGFREQPPRWAVSIRVTRQIFSLPARSSLTLAFAPETERY